MRILDQIDESNKTTLKVLLDSETGTLLQMLAERYRENIKEHIYRGCNDPEEIRRKRMKGHGVDEFWSQIQKAAQEVRDADSNAQR